ncbi:MAG: hypothetical protein ACLQNE_01535 [Thermoguttaceae bacterium]
MGYAQQQKDKGIRLSLTWFEPREFWKKKVKGTVVYFKFPNTARGYEQAIEAWAAWKSEHEQPFDPDGQRQCLERMVEWYRVHGEPEGEKGRLLEVEAALASNKRVPTRLEITNNYLRGRPVVFESVRQELDEKGKWGERFRIGSRPSRRKLTDFVTLFLESKLAQVNGQVRKPKTYGDLVDRFKPLKAFVGSSTLDSLNENLLRRYYNHVLSLNLSGYRQKNLFKAFLSLTRWLSSEGYLDKMPCNLGGPWEFVEHLKDGQRQTPEKLASFLFTKDDVARCLTKLGPTGRACVLLGLNCGFTEADIAVLRKSQVNLTEGRLIYSRTKTVRVKNAPMINYRLWNVTIEALRAVESQSEDLWFLTSEGQPLKTSKIVEGRHVEWSVIAKSWQVWRESGKVPDKPFKMLRKTGDTIIGDSRYRAFTELYLADKPTSIAGKHYDIKSGKVISELDKAIVYLGKELGLS